MKYNKHLIIMGSARSGTSWLSESISHQRGYRLLFEPDHPNHVKEGKLIADRWLKGSEHCPDLERFFAKLLRNRIDNDWIAQHSFRKFKIHLWPFLTKFYIIKLIRSNLAIEYLLKNIQVPVIKIVRNPESVLLSQLRVKFPWLFELNHFAANEELFKYVLANAQIDLSEKYDEFESLVIRWAIENALFPAIDGVPLYRYEDLSSNYSLVGEVMKNAGMVIPSDLNYRLSRPSSKTHPRSVIRNKHKESEKKMTELQKSTMKAILSKFPNNPYPLSQL